MDKRKKFLIFLSTLFQLIYTIDIDSATIVPNLSSKYVSPRERAILTCRVYDNDEYITNNAVIPEIEWRYLYNDTSIRGGKITRKQVRNKFITKTSRLSNEYNLFESVLWLGFDGGIKDNQFGYYVCRVKTTRIVPTDERNPDGTMMTKNEIFFVEMKYFM